MSNVPTRSKPVSLESLWDQANFHPNDAQRDAILHVDGPLYITAGPGSGKTRVLLWRTLNLIAFHDVAPEQIFLSTFTEKAALQLKEGLQSLLGMVTNHTGQPYDLAQMYIGTVHSLCQKVLSDRRRFSGDRHRNHPPSLLDELGQYFHITKTKTWNYLLEKAGLGDDGNQTINLIFGSNSQSKHIAVTNCISLFNRISEECINPKSALDLITNRPESLQSYLFTHELTLDQIDVLFRMYSAYLDTLITENGARQTDFALLQQETLNVLERYDQSGSVFKYVIVDEYQDTNTIQERLFFKLASGNGNISVVGDDDQALYRFRGATVENFVMFPQRCQTYLGVEPRRIALSMNYRSRKHIVDFYKSFIEQIDWSRKNGNGGFYRVTDKNIQAFRQDKLPAVIATSATSPINACAEIASLVKKLVDEGKVSDPNQVAVLFPSMKNQGKMNEPVRRLKDAFNAFGLKVYAPRAGRFLEVDESYDIFGLYIQVFGRPQSLNLPGHDYNEFEGWLNQIKDKGSSLMQADQLLSQFIKDKRDEIGRVTRDYQALMEVVSRNRWSLSSPYLPETMKRPLYGSLGLSDQGKKLLSSSYLERIVKDRLQKGSPLSLSYILKRITSLDWNVLDLFYRFCGFDHFKNMFSLAEQGIDEGPVANLALISQYLGRFMDEYIPLITADLLRGDTFQKLFFFSYLFALFRLGETEYEDADDPFPKGRVPFLTIHQSKGLEFPVVILANPRKDNRGPQKVEVLSSPFFQREPGEPLEKQSEFDAMRMFYVALSRAKNLLVIAHYRGPGQRINEPFRNLLSQNILRIPDVKVGDVPKTEEKEQNLPKVFSYTADYLQYVKCPRQYMIFRKFDFTPSRSTTMFFGNLVHRTLEDLHHELIRRRGSNG